jgi:hypothetical protein
LIKLRLTAGGSIPWFRSTQTVKDRRFPMTIIKPTVGRVVWYWPAAVNGVHKTSPHKADIVAVHSDTCVNLSIFNEYGVHYTRSSVILAQDEPGFDEPERPYAAWMPYQIGQAAKREQTQADAACPSVCDECPTDDAAPSGQAVDIHMPSIKSGVIFTGNSVNVHFERY